jgi:type I restriction enzyme, R subunit
MDDFPEIAPAREDDISQVPALQLLQNLGFTYLPSSEANALRGHRLGNVLLEGILEEQLRKVNRIHFKGGSYAFSEANIQNAIQAIKDIPLDGLIRTNEKVYDLLTLGKSLSQSILGDTKSFPFRYVDWSREGRLTNNVFHVTEEFVVERTGSHEVCRPDIVLFVNGIPFAVIECKRPSIKDPIHEAVSQVIGYQRNDSIPRLFLSTQILLAVSKNEAKYGTTGSSAKFWAVWKERGDVAAELGKRINLPLDTGQKDRLFRDRSHAIRSHFDALEATGREITEQDRAIYALCRPERLLELTERYVLFDGGQKKIARYQQYFTVRSTLERIRTLDHEGKRTGGVVWHTQGSGKSLTMVMLAKAIAMESGIDDFKIVLVTDRVDLDDQIYKTFRNCGTEPVKANSGQHLSRLLNEDGARIITTVINKFEAAVGRHAVRNDDPNVFVLVDESHRTQYNALHANMRKALTRACFIGFTGTPVAKKDKNTITKFGGIIPPPYTIREAVEDKAVVPLLYEGRHVPQIVDRSSIDRWFDRVTATLTPEQRADLKKKFASADQLNRAEQKVKTIAYDIGGHFHDNFQGFKAQLVASRKATALLYKSFLDECGLVSSEVLISGPDEPEGDEDGQEDDTATIVAFWKRMMERFGSEKEYNRQLINAFTNGDEPEIIIVVDKLLTGFDAPRNTVLYLMRKLQDHTLLQAIARVNRLYDGKEFGYILDYYGVLQNLDKALDLYGKLSAFDGQDLDQALNDIHEEVKKLPQRHSELWALFQGVRSKRDEEQYERLLADEEVRAQFYERLSIYARTLAIALSSVRFLEETPDAKIQKYRSDLGFFMKLRSAVKRRYAEVVDFKEYEARIQKLVDIHVGTGEVEQITELVNIFDPEAFALEVEKVEGTASKADTIAYRTKKTIKERMGEDPAFYRKFSEMLEDVIKAFREQRLSDAEYLKKVMEISESVRNRTGDDLPGSVRDHSVARAFYGVLLETFAKYPANGFDPRAVGAEAGLAIDRIVAERRVVHWDRNPDVQNRMKTAIEDYLFELKDECGFELTLDDIDRILEQCLDIARLRYSS